MKRYLILGLIIVVIGLIVAWYTGIAGGLYTETGFSGKTQQSIDGAKNDAYRVIEQAKLATPGAVTIYDGISFPQNTIVVDLGKQGLTGSLKAEVRQLSNLKELYLNDNDFTGVPAEVGQLANLETLDLSNNPRLAGLPLEIGNLKKLKLLNVSGTSYSKEDLEKIQQMLPNSTQVIVRRNQN